MFFVHLFFEYIDINLFYKKKKIVKEKLKKKKRI